MKDGPFTEAKELIAGFWLIQAKNKEEAIEWARRVPFVDGEIEVRQVFELEDFGQSDAVEIHARLRDNLARSSPLPRFVDVLMAAGHSQDDRRCLAARVRPRHRRARAHRPRHRRGRGSRAGRAGGRASAMVGVGIPDNPGAWLTGAAKHRAIDYLRRGQMVARKHGELAYEIDNARPDAPDLDAALDDDVGDDMLRLIFTACHPVLSAERAWR